MQATHIQLTSGRYKYITHDIYMYGALLLGLMFVTSTLVDATFTGDVICWQNIVQKHTVL